MKLPRTIVMTYDSLELSIAAVLFSNLGESPEWLFTTDSIYYAIYKDIKPSKRKRDAITHALNSIIDGGLMKITKIDSYRYVWHKPNIFDKYYSIERFDLFIGESKYKDYIRSQCVDEPSSSVLDDVSLPFM